MANNEVVVGKIFSFDSSHQLVGHCGKCANVHGHTYKLEVMLKGSPQKVLPLEDYANKDIVSETFRDVNARRVHADAISDEGFVIDFYLLKQLVNKLIVDKMDHAFLARGDEPILPTLKETGAKVVVLGFRTTVENMARYICWRLMKTGLPVYCIRMWETPTGWAEVYASDIDIENGPDYAISGVCDLD